MSSIMRWRSGLMAVSVIAGSCREVEGPNPSILTTGPSPVIVCPSAGYRPKAIALPQPQCLPARAGSFNGTGLTLAEIPHWRRELTFIDQSSMAQVDSKPTFRWLAGKSQVSAAACRDRWITALKLTFSM
jgi:hypothetical protein